MRVSKIKYSFPIKHKKFIEGEGNNDDTNIEVGDDHVLIAQPQENETEIIILDLAEFDEIVAFVNKVRPKKGKI